MSKPKLYTKPVFQAVRRSEVNTKFYADSFQGIEQQSVSAAPPASVALGVGSTDGWF